MQQFNQLYKPIIYSVFVVVIICNCSIRSKNLPFTDFKRLTAGKNVLVISCIRCVCTDQMLEQLYKKQPAIFNNFDIYADSACSIKGFKPTLIFHIPQASIDSISADLYNLAIIYTNEKIVKLVTTEEMDQLEKLLLK